jgi:hypothetical protein
MIAEALIAPKAISFFRNWGAPILAGLLAFGVGFGFWLYVGEINKARRDAEAKVITLETEVAGLNKTATDNAVEIAGLKLRLDAEQELSQLRLTTEQDRRTAAEARNSRFAGALDALRQDLDTRQCGIGSDLSVGLRDARDAREAERRSRETGY